MNILSYTCVYKLKCIPYASILHELRKMATGQTITLIPNKYQFAVHATCLIYLIGSLSCRSNCLFLLESELHDFNIWTSRTFDPAKFSLQNATLFGKYKGHVPTGTTVTIRRRRRLLARYIIIQIPGAKEVLSLCEVQVSSTGTLLSI